MSQQGEATSRWARPIDIHIGEKARPVQDVHPFVLSEVLPVVLVQRILKGEYVDMAELL